MRIWECDKCGLQVKSMSKPINIYDVKIFKKAQSKGGVSIGYNLCNNCALKFFSSLKKDLLKMGQKI